MKFFTVDRVRQAIQLLQQFDSKWVIVPLVFAVNGMDTNVSVNPNATGNAGTGRFLDLYFDGGLIGLPAAGPRNALRPKFADVTVKPGDLLAHQRVNLWGSGYSSRGYREMAASGLLTLQSGHYQLDPRFWAIWQLELPGTFHFEEFLVWLYAFSGMSDGINRWDQLFDDFQNKFVRFPAGYSARFNVGNGVRWPNRFETQRPSNEAFRAALIPSALTQPEAEPPPDWMEFVSDNPDPCDLIGLGGALDKAVAALQAGKHVVLFGPPGSGKTELARCICQQLGIPHDITTATSDWSTFDTIGGYLPDPSHPTVSGEEALNFFPGIFSRAMMANRWLIIDELNRADIDKAFGQMFTAISLGSEDAPIHLPYKARSEDGLKDVVIGSSGENGSKYSIPLPTDWRMIATMNTFDKASLFQLSFAFMRRFAFIEVPVPDAPQYRKVLETAIGSEPLAELPGAPTTPAAPTTSILKDSSQGSAAPSPGTPAPAAGAGSADALLNSLSGLFAPADGQGLASLGLFVGPAVAIDMIRHVKRRYAATGGKVTVNTLVLEAAESYLYPQFEGRDRQHVTLLEILGRAMHLDISEKARTGRLLATWTGYEEPLET